MATKPDFCERIYDHAASCLIVNGQADFVIVVLDIFDILGSKFGVRDFNLFKRSWIHKAYASPRFELHFDKVDALLTLIVVAAKP